MLSTLSLKHKSLAAFIVIAVLATASGLIGAYQTAEMTSVINHGQELRAQQEKFSAYASNVREQALSLKTFVLTGDRGHLADATGKTADIEGAFDALSSLKLDAKVRETLELSKSSWATWRDSHLASVVEYMRDPSTIDLARLEETSGANRVHLESFFSTLAQIEVEISAELSSAEAHQTETANLTGLIVGGASAIIALMALGLGALNFGLMSKISRTMATMADGERTGPVEGAERTDEIGAMARAANAFQQKLEDIEQAEIARITAERKAAEERETMLARLNTSFGEAVDAAIAGDFKRAIDAQFEDATLNELAGGVNRLLASVDAGISETTRVARRLAEGDLTAQMEGRFAGAFAELQSDLNSSLSSLDNLVADISSGSAELQRASQQIQKGSVDLSSRAESQASSLEETAATMEEMSATIRANAENAEQARCFSSNATDRARRGDSIVREAVGAMARIEESSTKISAIISVIDGIAFQTNLLALNAAVEAARAGDAGKGFAVVASEVRQLAQRSADAAKDITALISDSSANVSSGAELVQRAGDSLSEIAESVESVASAVAEITSANREQASGVEEISNSVSHMDQMTQQNAAMAEESAASARELAATAEKLDTQVRVFKTSQTGSPAKAPPMAAPKATPRAAPAEAAPAAPVEYKAAVGEDWASF